MSLVQSRSGGRWDDRHGRAAGERLPAVGGRQHGVVSEHEIPDVDEGTRRPRPVMDNSGRSPRTAAAGTSRRRRRTGEASSRRPPRSGRRAAMRTRRRSRVRPARRPTRSIRRALEQRPEGAGCVARRPAADEVGQVVRSERRIARVPAGVRCVHSGRGSGDERQRRRHSCGGPARPREWKSVCMRDPFPRPLRRRRDAPWKELIVACRRPGYKGLRRTFQAIRTFPRRSERS